MLEEQAITTKKIHYCYTETYPDYKTKKENASVCNPQDLHEIVNETMSEVILSLSLDSTFYVRKTY